MPQPQCEMIALTRSSLSRATGSKITGEFLLECAKKEKPYMKPVIMDNEKNEHWVMEKQFWLKYKKHFQNLGFLPLSPWNKTKKIKQMMEKF